ncbi:hypothetical protein F5146DRAFT_1140393 [Armillaria mellea]|nr:hypothetical protein F5146DRAFT_1140393 [Armillaria mellea]
MLMAWLGGRGRKAKHGEEPVLTQLEVKTAHKQKCYKVLQQITLDDGEAPAKHKANLEECIKILSDAHKWDKLMPHTINLWVKPEDVLLEGIEHLLGSESTPENGSNLDAFDALASIRLIDLSNDLKYFVDVDDSVLKISTSMVKHLLTSDGIPGKLKGLTHLSIAKMYKIKMITGHIIAYGACQACYALSSVDGWTCCDGKFNLEKFYEVIVDMYEDFSEDLWAMESLVWWNKEIFGNSEGADDDNNDNNTPPLENTVFKMAEAHCQ